MLEKRVGCSAEPHHPEISTWWCTASVKPHGLVGRCHLSEGRGS